MKKEEEIENRITSYLKNKFSFTCIEVKNAADRIRIYFNEMLGSIKN
ncbi:hypothetical protein [Clostridium paraputrificum]